MPLNALPPTTTPENLVTKVTLETLCRNRIILITTDPFMQVNAARGQCWVDVGFWGGVIPGNTDGLKVNFFSAQMLIFFFFFWGGVILGNAPSLQVLLMVAIGLSNT